MIEVFIDIYSTRTDDGISGGFGVIINVGGDFFEKDVRLFQNTTADRLWLHGITSALRFLPLTDELSKVIVDLTSWKWVGELNHYTNKLESGVTLEQFHNLDLWNDLSVELNMVLGRVEFVKTQNTNKQIRKMIEVELKKGEFVVDKIAEKMDVDSSIEVGDVEFISKKYPEFESISVSAHCSKGDYGKLKYHGVHTKTKEVLFKEVKFPMGSKNTGEFLAIVHVLALWKRENKEQPIIYSNNLNAIEWAKGKYHATGLRKSDETEKIYDLLERAVIWLNENEFDSSKIRKWETKIWGEIPSKFK